MTRAKLLLAALLAMAFATEAAAQRRPAGRPRAERPPPARAERPEVPAPLTGPYSRPPGYTGTIMWNTPDANGNFSTSNGGGGGNGP